jgi:PhoH-like ATPase
MSSQKLIILDTNVLIEDANALMSFENEIVGIPIMVLEELDRIKNEASFRGRNAREAIRVLDNLRSKGNLREGVRLDNGTEVRILFPEGQALLEMTVAEREVDNKILALCQHMQSKGFDVELVSKDINLRVKADALGIPARDYLPEAVDETSIYRGWTTIETSAFQLKKDMPDQLMQVHKEHPFVINEFIILQSAHNPFNVRLFRYLGNDQFKHVQAPELKWSLQPRNIQQRMALDLLFDNAIKLVTLVGPAGTGKTFLALVAALHEVLIYENFEKILVTRPVIPLGPDIGYLPGDVREKLLSWMQPIYDNMDFIVHAAHATQKELGIYRETEYKGYEQGRFRRRKAAREGGLPSLEELIARHKMSLEAITYMRGRSIPYQFIIIDEVQNLTTHEVKTLISRVGEGSKVILTGDPYQIDAHHLDFSNNGLVVTTQRFKGQSLFGTVFLETTERSELSRLAATLL